LCFWGVAVVRLVPVITPVWCARLHKVIAITPKIILRFTEWQFEKNSCFGNCINLCTTAFWISSSHLMDINRVILIGNVTRQPRVAVKADRSLATFTVATNRRVASASQANNAQFHHVTAWGKLADLVGKFVRRGEKVYIDGHLRYAEWVDSAGAKHARTDVVADQVLFLSPKKPLSQTESDSDPEFDPVEISTVA